ncbi:MAG: hypothetical protein F6J87_26705 [Spirulina sp. SIO3F2]|nr:hypothetical protein [Spirulina sp. SIO3F2]
MSTFEQILDQVSALPVEQQERLVEAIQQGIRSARRKELAAENLKPLNTDEAGTTLRIAIAEPDEAELIERIRLAPPFDGERLAVLQAKRDAGTLPEAELLEWQQLKIAADMWQVEHQAALVKLSSLRGVDLPEIQAEFGLPVTKQKMKGRLDELRAILAEDNFTLVAPERSSRATPFD